MYNLRQIMEEYPGVYYDQDHDTLCIDINEEPMTIETEASELIENHFEGETVCDGDFTDPNSNDIPLTGKDYVRYQLGGVVEACKQLRIEVV